MRQQQQESNYRSEMDEWADLSAWQGYEFWSAQLEADLEGFSELQQALSIMPIPAQEGRSDVQPF